MTATYKVGAGSSGGAYIRYLMGKALETGHKLDAVARYYAGREVEQPALSPVAEMGRAVHVGDVSWDAAISELVLAEISAHLPSEDLDYEALEEQITRELNAAATNADFAEAGVSLGGAARLRPDLDPALARVLKIDMTRPLTVGEMANLMDNRTVTGQDIEGKKRHNAHRSVAETFGLDPKEYPPVEAVRNVLAGKRIDGTAPAAENGVSPIPARMVESSVRKFKSAIGVPAARDATDEEIQRVADGRIDGHDYRKQISAIAPPIGYVDVVFNADKSVSVAHAVAPTDAESEIIRSITEHANTDMMAYLEGRIGIARSGAGGLGPSEPAKLAWISTEHIDARPTVDVVRVDAQGRPYTDWRDVPGQVDPHLHHHNVVPSVILAESGRVASLNLDLLDGEVKVAGAIGHAALATHARKYGIDVVLGPNGEARFAAVPEAERTFFSRRTLEGTDAAKEYAKSKGKDWDHLSPAEQVSLLNLGVASTRRDKLAPEVTDASGGREAWQEDARRAGFNHRSVLRPDEIAPELTSEQRIEIAREVSLPLLDKAFQARSALTLGNVREIAARGLIASGIGVNPEQDIESVLQTYRTRGITLHGETTELLEATTLGKDGRKQTVVTTGRALEQEDDLTAMVRSAAGDRSTALTAVQIDGAAERFLAARPLIDPAGLQWVAQRQMVHQIGEGARVSLSIGVAGSGKTSAVVATLVDAWHADGRTVYGMTVPWKASAALRGAGVDHALAIDAFLQRVEKGQYTVDAKTVIVADEVSQIGVRQQIALLTLAARTGAQLVEIGDPRQCQSIETPGIELMAKAIGDEQIPKLLTTIRQRSEHDRAVATMFRDGEAADGVAALRDDGRFHLVPGGRDQVIRSTTELWRSMTDANKEDPDYSLLVMTPTNAQALAIGTAIRHDRQRAGEIGSDAVTLKARDPNSGETFDLPIAAGDRVRLFSRVYDADTPGRRKWLASNGDVVEIKGVEVDGLRVQNAGGEEGRVTWSQMKPYRAPMNDPVMATYGYAVTVDTAQSRTETATILAFPEGTGQVVGNKAYTGMSRFTTEAHMVVSDAAERRAIVSRQMLGRHETPRQEDVIRNIATNLSRFGSRETATDLIARAIEIQRGAVRSFLNTSEMAQRRDARGPGLHVSGFEVGRLAEKIHRQAVELAHQVQQRIRQQPSRGHERQM